MQSVFKFVYDHMLTIWSIRLHSQTTKLAKTICTDLQDTALNLHMTETIQHRPCDSSDNAMTTYVTVVIETAVITE